MEDKLEDYNMEPGIIGMNLVLFRDAIEHGKIKKLVINVILFIIIFLVARIIRVIRQPRGNMLLVGVGGSGRQSLSRLSAYIVSFCVFQIEVTRHYRLQEFREGMGNSSSPLSLFPSLLLSPLPSLLPLLPHSLSPLNNTYCILFFPSDIRKLYYQAGVENKPTVFLFTDTQVVDESFLEDINNILSSGEVPNLYKPEDFEEVSYYMYSTCLCALLNCLTIYMYMCLTLCLT